MMLLTRGLLNLNLISLNFRANLADKLDKTISKLDVIIGLLGVDIAADILGELTDEESEFLDAFASVATALLQILPTAVIESTLVSLQSVFLNGSAPADLKVNYRGEEITFLSASMFSGASDLIDVFKIFVSALMIYGWLLVMRRKLSDVFGG